MAGGSLLIVAGSPLLLVGVPDWTVMGSELVGEGIRLTLRGTAETAVLVLLIPAAVVVGGSIAVGSAVTAVAVAGGWMLSCGGRVLSFVPDRPQRSLMFSEPVGACCPTCC